MSGFARYLPLSQRGPADESAVTSDRRAAVADVLDAAAALLPAAGAAEAARRVLADARLADEAGDAVDPAVRLRELAATVRTGPRRSIRALSLAVRALLRLARERGVPAALDPMIAGAVALYASAKAPADRRAAIGGHTVRATDAAWSFGAGPVLEGTAESIAAFLLGVSDEPPRPVISPRA